MVRIENGRFRLVPELPIRRRGARDLLERGVGDRPQSAQRGISSPRAELQLMCDIATAFMVAAMGEDAAGLFENDVHVGNRSIIQSGHLLPLRALLLERHPLRAMDDVDDNNFGKKRH